MTKRATIAITLRRDDGVTISREVEVTGGVYESQAKFRVRVRRQTISAMNAVLGVPKGVKIEEAVDG